MAKNTPIFTLLQNFISQEEIDGILSEFGFEDTARKCDVPTLLVSVRVLNCTLALPIAQVCPFKLWKQQA